MFYDRSSPWMLKGGVVLMFFLTRGPGDVKVDELLALLALPVAVQLAMLTPSVLLSVRDRRKTTLLISETVLMFVLMCVLMYAGRTGNLMPMEVATAMQMCTLHVFYIQAMEMQRHRRLLVGEGAWQWVALGASVAFPTWMVLKTPGIMPSTKSMLLVLFSGEVLGTTAAIHTKMLLSLAIVYETALDGM
jgi:hypothetical protein